MHEKQTLCDFQYCSLLANLFEIEIIENNPQMTLRSVSEWEEIATSTYLSPMPPFIPIL